ncbi:MAG: 5-formyltetrahydrofolate cyclo-ligase [Burkholderiales bacterium]|nr:5-formyltetrahydrofolate cyclo-ligase [Burkholderiales bacterium]
MTQPTRSEHQRAPYGTLPRKELRKLLLQQRRALDPQLRREMDARIVQKLLAWCQQHRPASLGVYWPIQAEPDLHDCYQQLSDAGIALALPLVTARNAGLSFLAWRPGDAVTLDEYGIPTPARRDRPLQPVALLVPCVGFNADRYRLGYGGGHYDRTLEQTPRPATLGVAYQTARVDFVPGAHDVAMDVILTDA